MPALAHGRSGDADHPRTPLRECARVWQSSSQIEQRALGAVKLRTGGDRGAEVRDPTTASGRLTRWNSWTDGQSPDEKRTQTAPAPAGRAPSSPPESATRTERQSDDDQHRPSSAAMRRALALAATPGVPLGPNPRVGCVLLAPDGTTIAEGFHRGAGTPHAEVARAHRGRRRRPRRDRRGHPRALQPHRSHRPVRRGAGRRRRTPRGLRPGGPQPGRRRRCRSLRAAGVEVEAGLLHDEARALNRAWTFAVEHRRPFVTWKFATTLDGRSAAADGTSRWVSSRAARRDTHRLRAACDAMLVGTGTVEVDDPELTVRDELRPAGRRPAAARGDGPARPRRRPPDLRRPRRDGAPAHPRPARRRWPGCYARDRQHVFLEGGPTLARRLPRRPASSTRSSPTSRRCCSARGASAVADLGITTIADALHLHVTDVSVLQGHDGEDTNVRLTMRRARGEADVHRHRRGARHRRRGRGPGRRLRLTVRADTVLEDTALGDSIAVNGCCLTVAEIGDGDLDRRRHAGDARQDLARRSRAGRPGQPRARRHRRQAARRPHRPGPRRRRRRGPRRDAQRALGGRRRSRCPPHLARYLVDKGSITVDGVSLTVVEAARRPASPSASSPRPSPGPRSAPAASATGSTSRSTSSPSTSRSCSRAARRPLHPRPTTQENRR